MQRVDPKAGEIPSALSDQEAARWLETLACPARWFFQVQSPGKGHVGRRRLPHPGQVLGRAGPCPVD